MDSLRITYASRPDTTKEGELNALVDVYEFVLRCAEEKKRAGVGPAQDDDRKESKMMIRTPQVYLNEDIPREELLPALRALFSQYPATERSGAETLARLLWVLSYLPYQPPVFEVEAALEALNVEDEVLA